MMMEDASAKRGTKGRTRGHEDTKIRLLFQESRKAYVAAAPEDIRYYRKLAPGPFLDEILSYNGSQVKDVETDRQYLLAFVERVQARKLFVLSACTFEELRVVSAPILKSTLAYHRSKMGLLNAIDAWYWEIDLASNGSVVLDSDEDPSPGESEKCETPLKVENMVSTPAVGRKRVATPSISPSSSSTPLAPKKARLSEGFGDLAHRIVFEDDKEEEEEEVEVGGEEEEEEVEDEEECEEGVEREDGGVVVVEEDVAASVESNAKVEVDISPWARAEMTLAALAAQHGVDGVRRGAQLFLARYHE